MPLRGTLGTGGRPNSAATFTSAWPAGSSDALQLQAGPGSEAFFRVLQGCMGSSPHLGPAVCQPLPGGRSPEAGLFSSRVTAINIRRVHSPNWVILLCL